MADLRDSWELTTTHLTRAASMAADQDLTVFRDYLGRNELALAADVLAELVTDPNAPDCQALRRPQA